MKGKIVGIKKTDTTVQNERFKSTKFNLILDYVEKGLTGQDVGVLSWNELENGEPPSLTIGQEIKVRYNKRAKLEFDDQPGTGPSLSNPVGAAKPA
jgi:hypothetical protein